MKRRNSFSIFVSYSHKDRRFQSRLVQSLQAWLQIAKGGVWHDGAIVPGTEFKPQILQALRKADVILLLISVDFLTSPFIRHHELQAALRRHNHGTARVIPVLLSAVPFWEKYPFGSLQVLPSGAKPIEKWGRRADAYADVIQGIARAVSDLTSRRRASRRRS